MPSKQRHRGSHSNDARIFGKQFLPALREAVSDLSWLLNRGYSEKSALKLTGDRYFLNKRQRLAVLRCACADGARQLRKAHQVRSIKDKPIAIDGYNLLITMECALAGARIFKGRDGCMRDIASVHGTYRKVEETMPALQLILDALKQLRPQQITWYLDAPVSNSWRLKTLIGKVARENHLTMDVVLDINPDRILAESNMVVITTDSWIIDRCNRWYNLAAELIHERVPTAKVVDLDPSL